ncbi:MAG: 1-acyl-sn-glycerol-3-phosphate acyltransferase [Acidimicrobiia bacterium]|nr:1-acyl-sn-glycerol-3-phosphate acyltransferase [Acidimicrobiia bacterium]
MVPAATPPPFPGPRRYGRLYPVARAVLGPACSTLWHIDVQGLDHVPATGPAVIAANHVSFLDSVFLMATLPRRITFVGKAEYLDSWKTRYLFPNVGMIPIDRSGGDASKAALDAAAEVLARGELFGIFPEGTRSRSGLLHRGRTGAARLALANGAPIVPVGIKGTETIQPPDAKLPKLRAACSLEFRPPLDPGRFAGREHDPRAARQLTDELMFEIMQSTGQTYVDQYAGESPPADRPTDLSMAGAG